MLLKNDYMYYKLYKKDSVHLCVLFDSVVKQKNKYNYGTL